MLYHITAGGFVLLSLACLWIIFKALKMALEQTDYSQEKQKKIYRSSLIVVALWIVIISLISLTGFFLDFSTFPPRMMIVLAIPFIIILMVTFSGKMKTILSVVPPQWLHSMQSFRVLVEILIWMLFLAEVAPIQMTFEGRNYDILVGLTGPLIGYLCFIRRSWSPKVAIVWNLLGLLILGNILVIALLSMPTPMRYFMNEPANTIVARFPVIWLPGILVPIAYSMHFFALRQLLNRNKH